MFLTTKLNREGRIKNACHVFLYVVVQPLSHVQLFVTSWTAACQAFLSFTISQSLLKFLSIESVIPSNYLILCRPLLLRPSIFPSITVFSNESPLGSRWPKYRSFSFSIISSNEYSGLIFFLRLTGLISLQSEGLSRVFSNTTVQKHQFFIVQPSLWSNSYISSVQFSGSVMSDSSRPHESQHARPPCPSPTPGVHSDSRPSSQ